MRRLAWVGVLLLGMVEIFPVEEVKPGMHGVLRTVLKGTEVSEIPFVVEGVYPNFYPGVPVVMIRLQGIGEETGVVAGMSGSPVFIDGKLLGALAYGFGFFVREPLAGVTPFSAMLAAGRFAEERRAAVAVPWDAEERRAVLEGIFRRDPGPLVKALRRRLPRPAAPEGWQWIPLALRTPPLREEARQLLEELLQGTPLRLVTQGGAARAEGAPLEAGAPLVVPLVWGDLDLAAVGTVTWVEGDTVYGFGHPFFNVGAIRLPLAQGWILKTVASDLLSFKIGFTGKVVGALVQDRLHAVVGKMGAPYDAFPVEIAVQRTDGQVVRFLYQVAQDEAIRVLNASLVGLTSMLSVMSATMDNAPALLEGEVALQLRGQRGLQWTQRYGVYAGPRPSFNVGELDLWIDLVFTLFSLYYNPFRPLNVDGLTVRLRVLPWEPAWEVERVEAGRTRLRRGEPLTLRVTLRRYGQEERRQEVLRISTADLPAGSYRVTLQDGFVRRWNAELEKRFPETLEEFLRREQDLLQYRRDRLYLSLWRRVPGLRVKGQTYPALPATVRRQIGRARGQVQVLLREEVVPWEGNFVGAGSVYFEVKEETP